MGQVPGRAVRRAMATVREYLASHAARPDSRLPSVREMARRADVSYATMWQGMRRLVDDGVLVSRRGSGFYAARAWTHSSPVEAASSIADNGWRRIRKALEHDLLCGTIAPRGSLPTQGELGERYRCDSRTVRRALGDLCADGLITRKGRGFATSVRGRQAATGTVVLVAAGDKHGRIRINTYRVEEHLRELEEECARAGVRLAVVTYHSGTRTFSGGAQWAEGVTRGQTTALGYILWTINITESHIPGLARTLVRTARPLAILRESGERLRSLPSAQGSVQTVYMGDGFAAGHAVGRYLYGLGHRKMAFLSPYPAASWSRHRLKGLRKSVAFAVDPGLVLPYIVGEGSSIDGVLRQRYPHIDTQRNAMARDAVAAGTRKGPALNESDISRLLSRPLMEAALRESLETTLVDLARAREVTAWVCVTDTVAILARQYLQLTGEGDETVTIVGFDDRFVASLAGVTSYNFNGKSAIRALLSHVLRPRTRSRRTARPPVVVEGFVAERASTLRGVLAPATSAEPF